MTSRMQGIKRPDVYRFKLGAFEVTTILDSFATRDGLHPLYGGDRPADDVHALARANRLDPLRFEHHFVPTLVDTGKELILFDTGNGSLAKEREAMRARLPDGRLVALLAEAGYGADDIDAVVITHGHPDHIGGLTENGRPVFNRARHVFGAAEFDYWKRGENVRPARKGTRDLFVDIAVPFAERATFIAPGHEVAGGITAVDAAGHSPGMLAFHVESEGKRLLIWADVVNHYVVSLQRPDWIAEFDDDKDKAIATRMRILDMAAREELWVAGHHMPFPSVGYVDKTQNGYRWVPAGYQLNL